MKNHDTINPYKASQPKKTDGATPQGNGLDLERTRWIAIFLLVVTASWIVGIMMVSVAGHGAIDQILRLLGVILLMMSTGLFLIVPLIRSRLSQKAQSK